MYRTLDCGWSDDPKVRQLPTAGMLLFVYLIANRLSHVSGIYFLPDAMILDALKIDRRTLDTLWNTLASVGLAYRDKDRAVVLVPKMFRRQGRGEKNQRAAANQIASLHNSPLISKFLDIYPDVRQFLKVPGDTLSPWYPKQDESGIQDQDQERYQEQDKEEEKSNHHAQVKGRAQASDETEEFPSLPVSLEHPLIATEWADFCKERVARSKDRNAQRRRDWTPRAAAGIIRKCEEIFQGAGGGEQGAKVVASALREAHTRGWLAPLTPQEAGAPHGRGNGRPTAQPTLPMGASEETIEGFRKLQDKLGGAW